MLETASTGAPPAPDLEWPTKYEGAYAERRRTCGFQLYDAVGIEKGDRAASGKQMLENFRLFGAPHVAIVTTPAELGAYGALDCGGFVSAFATRVLGGAVYALLIAASFHFTRESKGIVHGFPKQR